MNSFDDEIAFRSAGSAAIAVLNHCATVIDSNTELWTFEPRHRSKGQTRAGGEFSRVVFLDVLLRDMLAIIATTGRSGQWLLKQDLTRISGRPA